MDPQLRGMFDRYSFVRLTKTPRPPADPNSPDRVDERIGAQLFAALTSANARLARTVDGSLAVAWYRPGGSRTLHVLVGGTPRFPAAQANSGGSVSVLYPPGTVGEIADTETLVTQWDHMTWVRCTGRPDALWTSADGKQLPGRGGFEDYVAHLPGGFCWLVVAEPLDPQAVDDELVDIEINMPQLRMKKSSEPARIELARSEARYDELSRAKAAGLWRVHVLVGAATQDEAHEAAGILCSASDLDHHPYQLLPHGDSGSLAKVWADRIDGRREERRSPFTATSELLVAIARPPRRELPGIRVTEPAAFDVTPETDDGVVHLGAVLDEADQPVDDYAASLATLNRHTFVAGATGSGKSQTVRHLLEGATEQGISWLVIEPAKAEYARMAGRIGKPVFRIRPGALDQIPVGLNPLEPEQGFPLQTHIDLVRALFTAAFDAAEPFPQVLAHALSRCYSDLGWDTTLGESNHVGQQPKYPSLSDLQTTALDVVDAIGYSREITDNVRGFIDVRISSLRLGTPGRFFEGGNPLPVADLLDRNVVLEIEDVGNDADKAFFIGIVLIRVYEHLRVNRKTSGATTLRHLTVVEEAHRLLRRAEPGTPAAHAVELFTGMLAEIRAYGEGIVVAEQIPAKISEDVIKNSALKIMHRLPAADDRETVGATMNLDEHQSRHVVSLRPGRAAVFSDGMDRPIRIEVPLGESKDSDSTAVDWGIDGAPTLRQLKASQRLSELPRFTIWIELLTAACLLGQPVPVPTTQWRNELTSHPIDTLQSAIEERVNAAIAARRSGLVPHFQPDDFASFLIDAAHQSLRGDRIDHQMRWHIGRPGELDPAVAAGHGVQSAYEQASNALSDSANARERLLVATSHLRLSSYWPLKAFARISPNDGVRDGD